MPPDDASSSQGNTLKLMRAVFLVLLVIFTALIIVTDSTRGAGGLELVRWWPLAVLGVLIFFAGVILLDVLTPKRKLSTISAIFVGLIAGVVVTAILGVVMDLFVDIYELDDRKLLEPFKILFGIGICYLTISTVLQTQDDFRLVIPYVEFAKKIRGARPVLLDTSALIDGRVVAIAETGFFQSPLIIPRFVIDELHALSDSADRLKRARGRRGLDMVSRLQRTAPAEVSIEETIPSGSGVDQMLIEMAKTLPAAVATTDSGLQRVAAIAGVNVLSLNDLATALKPDAIPGDTFQLSILRRGEQPGQGVGYLDDGTMVVVEDGEPFIGASILIAVTSTMQTSAGRLIFGRVNPAGGPPIDPARENPRETQRETPRESHREPASPPSPIVSAAPIDAPRAPVDASSPPSALAGPAGPAAPRIVPPVRPEGAPRSMRNPRRG